MCENINVQWDKACLIKTHIWEEVNPNRIFAFKKNLAFVRRGSLQGDLGVSSRNRGGWWGGDWLSKATEQARPPVVLGGGIASLSCRGGHFYVLFFAGSSLQKCPELFMNFRANQFRMIFQQITKKTVNNRRSLCLSHLGVFPLYARANL